MTDHADVDLPTLTVEQAAKLLGRSVRQVSTYMSRADDPLPADRGARRKRTMIALPDLFEWATRQRLADLVHVPTGEVLDPAAERAALDRARRLLAEQELARRAGSLIPADDVFELGARMVLAFRSHCLALPDRAAPLLVGLDTYGTASILRDLIDEALTALSEWDPAADVPADARLH